LMITLAKVRKPSVDNMMSTHCWKNWGKGGGRTWVCSPCFFHNGGENILNHIVGFSSFPTMRTTKKVSPCKISRLVINAMSHCES
jgi:hypothetical protein